MSAIRLAIVVTHPIQYFAHVYRRLGELPDLHVRVLFGSRIGLESYCDTGFGVDLEWQRDLLGGYDHEFLPGSECVRNLGWRSLMGVRVGEALDRFAPDAVLL